ncbi:hypothetical protein Cni_G00992 [Canna indica]|uniref:Uncharacterized protein n=1 Tax=Canna indica TaxID=4628 RepID=A0AAQ3JLQ4_9LILI|nr:hypothetical protein Cni_G00992 [Canna indica]
MEYFGNPYRGDPSVPHTDPSASRTYGLGPWPSPSSPLSILTCGNSPTSGYGNNYGYELKQ